MVAGEFLLAAGTFVLALWLLHGGDLDTARSAEPFWILLAALFATLIVMGIASMGLYSIQQRLRMEGVFVRLLVAHALAATGLAVLDLFGAFIMERSLWFLAFAFSLPATGGARLFFQLALDDEYFRRRVLVIGAGKRAANILELRRRSDQRGFRIVAFLPAAGDKSRLDDERVAETELSLLDYARQARVSEIVVAMDDRRRGLPIRELLNCKLSGIGVVDLLEFLERETGRVKVDLVNPGWIIFSEGFSRVTRRRLISRSFDLFASAGLFVVAAPIMVVTGLAVLLESGRPLLIRQRRVGLIGKEFTLYKFRSMRKDAEADGEAKWAQAGDNRITRVGRVIRRLRLDELPQLVNVIRGDMSFVGPRPERPEFVAGLVKTVPYYHERHYVKPGLTGWAQLCYPYGASEKDALAKLQFDMYYVKNRSLVFDLMILLQTVEVILWQKGSR